VGVGDDDDPALLKMRPQMRPDPLRCRSRTGHRPASSRRLAAGAGSSQCSVRLIPGQTSSARVCARPAPEVRGRQ
jgi:hypothetical protein